MTKEEHLLACLAEECAEVIKEVNKALRFGIDDFNPKDPDQTPTREKIDAELIDLFAVVEMLSHAGVLEPIDIHDERIDKKQRKVSKYMKYARKKGQMTD